MCTRDFNGDTGYKCMHRKWVYDISDLTKAQNIELDKKEGKKKYPLETNMKVTNV